MQTKCAVMGHVGDGFKDYCQSEAVTEVASKCYELFLIPVCQKHFEVAIKKGYQEV